MRGLQKAGAASVLWLVAASCGDDTGASETNRAQRARVNAEMDAGNPDAGSGGQALVPETKRSAPDAAVVQAQPKQRNEAQKPEQRPAMTPSTPERDEDAGAAKPTQPTASLEDLGQRLFQERALSQTGTQSCASCHASEQAFTGSADHDDPHLPVSRGALGNLLGTRNAPTAMYAQYIPPFEFREQQAEYRAIGGLFWDGRANTLSEQASQPFINLREMALPDVPALIAKVRKLSYAAMFEPLFGANPLRDEQAAYQHLTEAIAAFERTPRFHPFSSKFDASLRGQTPLSEPEQRGFELFKDNCISCHAGDVTSQDPQAWLFTDFSYVTLAVPRNLKIIDNEDASYFDLGLCQSTVVMDKVPAAVEDKAAFLATVCGAFRTPTLRNVARTQPYMHNGYFAELRDAVDFHVSRETDAARWYASTEGKYDDLPEQYWGNVTSEPPFDRKPGETPRLSSEELDAVVAFLSTLSDMP